MLTDQYIILNDDGTESELSKTLNFYRSGTTPLAIVATEDALYIGSDLPFNSRYFKLGVPNDAASTVTPFVWWGQAWTGVAAVKDFTLLSGATLGQSGVIEWTLDRLKGWDKVQDSESVDGISIEGLYDMYWLKLVFGGDLNALTTLQYVGHKFTEDDTLFDFYPDLRNTSLMDAFETGKTNWDEQHFAAAETIISDLRKNDVIKSANQILKRFTFERPSVYKTAEIIYQGLGNSFRDDRDDARKLYTEAMKLQYFDIDLNADAELSDVEKLDSMRFLKR